MPVVWGHCQPARRLGVEKLPVAASRLVGTSGGPHTLKVWAPDNHVRSEHDTLSKRNPRVQLLERRL